MLKWASKQAEQLRKIEKKEIEKRQNQFKNDLEKGGKKMKEVNNSVFEKNKSKINDIGFQDICKPWNHKCLRG